MKTEFDVELLGDGERISCHGFKQASVCSSVRAVWSKDEEKYTLKRNT